MKIGFVILCYGKADMVLKCIDYIERMDGAKETKIIVVDNNSPDGTGEIIKQETKQLKNVEVYLHNVNAGFAQGNNIGYGICVNKYGCDAVIVLNSDVFILDNKFLNKLKSILKEESDIAIIAPDIVEDDYKHKNPLSTNKNDMKDTKKYLKTICLDCLSNLLLHLHINYFRLKKRNEKANYNIDDVQKSQNDIVPHGACIIFTNVWIKDEKMAFYNGTFLFCEEHFLYAYAIAKDYKIAYRPKLVVKHLGDESINEKLKDERNRRIFVNRNQRISFVKFLKIRKNILEEWGKYTTIGENSDDTFNQSNNF